MFPKLMLPMDKVPDILSKLHLSRWDIGPLDGSVWSAPTGQWDVVGMGNLRFKNSQIHGSVKSI